MRRDNASNHITDLIACAGRLKSKGRVPGRLTLDMLGYHAELRDALKLHPKMDIEANPSLRAAFEAFGLDPRDSDNWRLLLALLAEAFFVPKRKRGGKEVWDSRALLRLLMDFWEVKRQNPQLKSEEKLCEKLTKKKGYNDYRPNTLRKMLYRARDPADNDILKLLLEEPDPIACADLMRKLST
jgi:hypothetical protein